MGFKLVVCVILFSVAAVVAEDCPADWVHRGKFCYKYIGEAMNWNDAQNYCVNLAPGGSLAYVGSEDDNNNVFEAAPSGDFWIALTDKCHEKKFSGPDGEVSSYTNWGAGEPNDVGLGGEDCVHIRTDRAWNDLHCDRNKRPFVCQLLAGPQRCHEGWVQRGDHCYRYFSDSRSWEDALTQCQTQGPGGTLPFIGSEEQNNEVFEAAAQSAGGECASGFKNFWIGITDRDVPNVWTSADGVSQLSSYGAWSPGEPNNSGVEKYVEMYINSKKWNDNKGSRPYVCQLPFEPECVCPECPDISCPDCPPCPVIDCPEPEPCPECPECPIPEPCPLPEPACPDMWTAYDGGCYQYQAKKASWDAANEKCAELGAHLVAPNIGEQQFLGDYLKMILGLEGAKAKQLNKKLVLWVGVHDMEKEGDFIDVHGEGYLEEVNQKKGKKKDCVLFKNGVLHANKCKSKQAFVCKK